MSLLLPPPPPTPHPHPSPARSVTPMLSEDRVRVCECSGSSSLLACAAGAELHNFSAAELMETPPPLYPPPPPPHLLPPSHRPATLSGRHNLPTSPTSWTFRTSQVFDHHDVTEKCHVRTSVNSVNFVVVVTVVVVVLLLLPLLFLLLLRPDNITAPVDWA